MSALLKSLKPSQILQIHKILATTQCDGARKCHWYPDYIPGPYPKTKEEREAAAKKYNLLPAEYEPYPNNEEGCGDYPKLPFHSVDSKDPWYPYDFPDLRKDFREPVHFAAVHLLPEGMTTGENEVKPIDALPFLAYLSTCLIILYGISKITYCFPKAEKQIPKAGVVHYTFDLVRPEISKKKPDPEYKECNK